jgi:hypothetical protein
MELFYLTGAQFGVSAIALKRLKISRFSDLNDPFEMLAVNLADQAHRSEFRVLKDEMNKNQGLLCFARTWENPVLWGHYGEKHTGMALGFTVPDHLPVKVDYAKRPLKIPIDAATKKIAWSKPLADKLVRTKFSDWAYEDERRMFVNLDHTTQESGLYFLNFGPDLILTEVILGSRCSIPKERVEDLLRETGQAAVVRQARLAFQSFRVVEHLGHRSGKHAT